MDKETLAEVIPGAIALSASTMAVAAYNSGNLNNTIYSYPGVVLPVATELFSVFAPLALLVPVAYAGLCYQFYRKNDGGDAIRVLTRAGYVFSVAWVAVALWAWYLPYSWVGDLSKLLK